MAVNLDDVLKLAEQLDSEQQNLLIYRLRVKQAEQKSQDQVEREGESERIADEWYTQRGAEYVDYYRDPTREQLIEEMRYTNYGGESLYGKYANASASDLSEEDFHAELHAIATEWEQELDDFDAD